MNVKSLYPIIVCKDVEATSRFYSEALGFSVKHSPTTKMNSKVLIMENAAGQQFELMEAAENAPVKLEPGLYGLRMNVDDIESAKDELAKNGCTIVMEPRETALGKIMQIVDANGVKITLIQHIK